MRNPFAAPTGLRRYTRAHLRHDRDAARAEVLRLEGVIRGLEATVHEQGQRIAQLEADAVDVGVERQLREKAERRADELDRELTALKAREANEHAVTVPPAHREVDPDDAPTVPAGIPVLTLPQALNPSAA
ncbi:hypothetical protein [Streptomyces sp. NPDC057413]|uniref:hypothetical protein n=1 Tax=Streptomyces sp. NPDC057413 TaxID=3346124 RepID=UPI003674F7CF